MTTIGRASRSGKVAGSGYHKFKLAGGLTLSVLLSGLSSVAWAQDLQEDDRMALEEVMVTAQKRDQSLQDVPIAITAITDQDIQRLNASEIKDLQYATPNMVIGSGNSAQSQYGIRGIADVSRNPGYDQRIGVYVDGVWVGRSAASNQSVLDVQTVEVLRGPQGTLFGKNTVSGAINIITRKPTEEYGGYAQADFGNYGYWRVKGAVNVPFTENFYGKISAGVTQRDGFVKDTLIPGKEYDDKDELAVRGQLLWNISDATSAELTYDDYRNHFVGLVSERLNDTLAPEPYEVALDATQKFKVENDGIALTVNHDFANDFQLASITAYRTEFWSGTDIDEDYTPLPIATSDLIQEDSDYFSQEFRLISPSYDKFDYVIGLYYLDQNIDGQGNARVFAQALVPSAPPVYVGVAYDAVVDGRQLAAYAHGNYRFSDSWTLTGGIRYTDEKKDLDYSIADTSGLFTNGTAKDNRSSSDWSPKVSLNWFANANAMLYASWSRAFKSGGWNTDFVNNMAALPFDDENVDAYELGLKSTFAEDRVQLNAALFHSNNDDFQVQSFAQLPNGGTSLTVTNAGKVSSQGLELDVQWLATDWLRLWATYGYTDASFDSFKDCAAGGVDCTDNRPAMAPKNNYGIGADMQFPLWGGVLFIQGDFVYRDDFYTNPNNLPVNLTESYHLFNGRLGWTSGSGAWTVYAWGQNLSDETAQIWNSRSFLGIARATYTNPRTYGLALRWNFGGYY